MSRAFRPGAGCSSYAAGVLLWVGHKRVVDEKSGAQTFCCKENSDDSAYSFGSLGLGVIFVVIGALNWGSGWAYFSFAVGAASAVAGIASSVPLLRARVKVTADALISYAGLRSKRVPVSQIADIDVRPVGTGRTKWKAFIKLTDGEQMDLRALSVETKKVSIEPPTALVEVVSEIRELIGLAPRQAKPHDLNTSGQNRPGVPTDSESTKAGIESRKQAYAAAWEAFPDLEGTHWTIRLTEGRWAIATRDEQKLLATINEGKKSMRPATRSVRHVYVLRDISEVGITDGPVYREQWRGPRFHRQRFFVDAYSDQPVIKVPTRHFDHRDTGQIHVLSQPSSIDDGPQIWRFPLEGTKPENAVMTAVDDLGETMMRFRRTPGLKESVMRDTRVVGADAGIDIGLSPGSKPSPELLLIAAVASSWMITYFMSAPPITG
jgi:hypothetical protein